ncbi:Nif3-like dinuclear metal center hexameric protein, partial [Francisella tularensis subsp. holarctica]|uniref:Nif3-like dinuclear metal center hexameric protein n=1 Tax=Francisella tularensis TaxID=263 RepID=UPI002381B715
VIAPKQQNNKVAICTGGAQYFIEYAYQAGADTFISGEISEMTTHLAHELGINYIATCHHATEKEGVKAIAEVIKQKFNLL